MDASRSNEMINKTLRTYDNDIAFILNTLGNTKRLQILTSLLKRPRTFSELQEATELGKTALAHHLGLLVKADVLNHVKRGHYKLSRDGRELLKVIGVAYAESKRRKERESAKRAKYIQKIHSKEGKDMKEFTVKIVELPPMRVASVQAISESPEHDAWEKMRAWAEPRGLLEDLKDHPVFGFNNPDPSPNKKEYGYEFWIRVDAEMKSDEVTIKDFGGGLYAVTTCNLKEELQSEFFKEKGYLESWKRLVDWVESSKYTMGSHQCLEKAHDPEASEEELILDLYCPIRGS